MDQSLEPQRQGLLSAQSDDGKWNKFGGRLAWDQSAICCNNPSFGGTGNAKTGEDYVAAPNIDHTQVGQRHPAFFVIPGYQSPQCINALGLLCTRTCASLWCVTRRVRGIAKWMF